MTKSIIEFIMPFINRRRENQREENSCKWKTTRALKILLNVLLDLETSAKAIPIDS